MNYLRNCWMGSGRICNDLEIRVNEKGKKVLFFTIAINEGTKEKPYTNFQDCVVYDGYAETIAKFFHKGDEIRIMGKNNTYTYVDRGEKRKRTNVVVDSFEFGQKKRTEEVPKEETFEEPKQKRNDYHLGGDFYDYVNEEFE